MSLHTLVSLSIYSITDQADTSGLPVFFFSWLGWKLAKKTKMVALSEIDFTSGLRELDAQQAEDEERFKPDTRWKKFVSILF